MTDFYDDLEVGQRVEFVRPDYSLLGVKPGARGSIVHPTTPSAGGKCGDLTDYRVVSVRWDSGSWLMLIPEAGDELRVLTAEEAAAETDVPPVTAAIVVAAEALVKPPRALRVVDDEASKAAAMLGAITGHTTPKEDKA